MNPASDISNGIHGKKLNPADDSGSPAIRVQLKLDLVTYEYLYPV